MMKYMFKGIGNNNYEVKGGSKHEHETNEEVNERIAEHIEEMVKKHFNGAGENMKNNLTFKSKGRNNTINNSHCKPKGISNTKCEGIGNNNYEVKWGSKHEHETNDEVNERNLAEHFGEAVKKHFKGIGDNIENHMKFKHKGRKNINNNSHCKSKGISNTKRMIK
jgi:hypothetical protein